MNNRFYAIDLFRGATVALMILVNNPGSWSHIYPPFEHAMWHGCTPTDLVFPFFLFVVGASFSFTLPRLQASGTGPFLLKVTRRALLIFLIGILLNWSPFIRWEDDHLLAKSFSNVRIFGVLQRIAISYFFAAVLICFFKPKQVLLISGVLLVGYWLLALFLGTPGDPFSLEGFWGTRVDRALLGNNHIYNGEGVPFDPEGLVSTITSVVQVVFGYLAGTYIRNQLHNNKVAADREAGEPVLYRLITHLFVWGLITTFAALCWALVFPLNKKIWTSSFVLYTTGLAVLILAALIYLVDVKQHRGWMLRFFEVFGKNPLFIFVLSGLLPRLLGLLRIPVDHPDGGDQYITPFGWFYEKVCRPVFGNPLNASLFYAICMVVFYWLIAWWLHKRKVYIRV